MSVPSLTTALCLPAIEIEALLQGRMIAAVSNTFRNPLQFALCPVSEPLSRTVLIQRYRPSFLRSLKPRKSEPKNQTTLYAWAKFGRCRIYRQTHDLAALSQLTVWRVEYLEALVRSHHKIFLMSLQVYRFEQPLRMAMKPVSTDKIGRYIHLPSTPSSYHSEPIIGVEASLYRQQLLTDLAPPPHLELEDLQAALSQIRESGLGAMSLDRDIRYLLGWSRVDQTKLYDSDFVWIKQIALVGNTGDEHEEFEKLVRRSLIKLGFSNQGRNIKASLNPDIAGEPDSLDVYCESPYSLVGMCKATQHSSVPNTVVEQFNYLGNEHLPLGDFEHAVKLLFVAGTLTAHTQQTAIENRMNVMRPETLQRLTELQAQHPGSIDLYRLKPCLQNAPFGEAADQKVNLFIDKILQQLEVRAELIRAVKNCLHTTGEESVGTDAVYFAYAGNASRLQLPQLSRQEVQETLIELSSPLAGYLGRVEDVDAPADRRSHLFYFLRELHVDRGVPC
ncbi:MAG: DUF1802 family protein [Cyanobacteria bacterium J06560_2]